MNESKEERIYLSKSKEETVSDYETQKILKTLKVRNRKSKYEKYGIFHIFRHTIRPLAFAISLVSTLYLTLLFTQAFFNGGEMYMVWKSNWIFIVFIFYLALLLAVMIDILFFDVKKVIDISKYLTD